MDVKRVLKGICIVMALCFMACNDASLSDVELIKKNPITFHLSGIGTPSRTESNPGSQGTVQVMTDDPEVKCTMTVSPTIASRAASVDETSNMGKFGVYAHRTVNNNNYSFYISNQQVNVNSDGGCSMTVEYDWPEDKSVLQFHAFYPFGSDNMTLPQSADESFAFDYQIPQDMAQQEDVLVASSTTFAGDSYTSVPLQFNHVCAQVKVQLDEGLEDFEIKSVSFEGVKYKGSYDYINGWDLSATTATMTGQTADAEEGAFVFMMMPQLTSTSAKLNVTIHNHISGTDQTYYMNLGQEWLQGYRMTYLISLTPEFNLKFTSQAEMQDAHYIIYPISIHAEEVVVGWTVTSDSEWATLTSSLTTLQEAGYWIEEDKGTVTMNGSESDEDIPLYVFLTENTGDEPRTATLSLYPTGYPEAARVFTVTQLPVQRSNGIGFECFEDDFGSERDIENPIYEYGFYWDRKVTYTSSDFFYRLIIHWSAQDAIESNDASSYVVSTYKFLNKTTVEIDYSKLNDLGENAEDTDTGFDNTWNLYNFRGVGNISAIEDVFDEWGINKDTEGGDIDKVQKFAAKVALMKNKFNKTQKTESTGGTSVTYDVPVINYEDVVWYLPVAAEYAVMSSTDYPLSGTYWTSEAVSDNVRAIKYTVGGDAAGAQELRTMGYRIRCARK